MFEFPHEFIVYLNAIWALFLVFVLYRGYKRGMLLQVVGLIGTFVSLIIAWLFSDVFVNVYTFINYNKTGISRFDMFVSDNANQMIWFLIIFIVIRLLMLVLTPIASMISKIPLIKQVNSILGALFSIVIYFVYMGILILFLTLPVITNGNEIIKNTLLKPIQSAMVPVTSFLEETVEKNTAIQSLLNNRGLSTSQKQTMINMLEDNGFTQSEIKEFLEKNE
ncbi:MAG: CvpA family protein [Erysipelothrix sp.]|nr:CvpA family protein [Erysipelothrix sp.]